MGVIDRIIRFSIYNKLIIGLGVAALVAYGIYSFTQLPIDAVPDITDNQVQVITTSPSLAAQEVEQLITFPLEMEFGNIPKVEEVRSVSRFGLSVITLVFEPSMDTYLARQLIEERLQSAKTSIPTELGIPTKGPITTGLGEIYQYVLYPEPGYEDKIRPDYLRTLQDWVVKRQLVGIKGVVEVNSSGGYLKQYEIAVDPEKLKSMGISLRDIFQAVDQNNANIGGSYIEKDQYTYFIRGEGRFETIQDIEEVLVKMHNKLPIRLKDVAKVQMGHAPRFGAVTMNGIGEVVAGQVLMLKGENAAAVTQRVKERMTQIEASLPEGVRIEPYLDRSKLVNRTTRTVATNLIEGGLIVIFVLVLLLGNLRAGLIVASVIPLSMLFAVILMRMFGVTANLMSLGAIDFGLIVDGAVIIVEAITHHLGLRKSTQSLSQADIDAEVFQAAGRTRKAAAFGEIIILIVYLPILFLSGVEGKMFRPMAQTVSFAIIGALILSLTYVPMMSALLLGKKQKENQTLSDRILAFLYRLYHPLLQTALKWKAIFVAITVGVFVVSLYLLNTMGGEFIPTLEEGDFALHQILPPGSSIAQGVEVSAELQNILLDKFPEVEKVVTKIGTAEIPTDIMPLEAGDIYVIMKPKSEWTSARTREEMFEKMEAEMNNFPGVIYEFTQPIQMRFNELMTGIRQDIAIKIYGEDLGVLVQKAREAEALINQIPGAGDIQVEPTAGLQQMVVDFDRAKLAKYGLHVAELNQMIRGSFAGEKAGYFYEGEKRFEVVVRLDAPFRTSIENLKKLYIPLENGFQIPLEELGEIRFEEGPTQISRDNTQRRITIGVNARGRDVQSLVEAIEQRLEEDLSLAPGYYVTYGGQFENLQRARARLFLVVPIALVLIFFLLFFTFSSLWQALVIFTAIPMSAIGGIWSLYLRGMPFSISAGVGFIALFGVAVLNGIVLIAYFNQLKQEGYDNVSERIQEGIRVRFRPVLMTALVASLGFLPMAFSTAAGAEVQRPLATVVIGGLITSTFLTLIILPILYYVFENRTKKSPNPGLIGFFLLTLWTGVAQGQERPSISLNEAIDIASANYPLLEQAKLKTERFQRLSQGAFLTPKTNIYYSTEEYSFEPKTGIHSFGFFQNLNFPGVNRSYRQWQGAQMEQSRQAQALTERMLILSVQKAYFASLYAQEKQQTYQSFVEEYREFERIAELRFEQGETSKIPSLSASAQRKSLQLKLQEARQEGELALVQLNRYLYSEIPYKTQEDSLPDLVSQAEELTEPHPFLLLGEKQQEVAAANVEVKKSQRLPQLQLGGQIQRLAGDFPFYGFQLGLNLPLFQRGYKGQIQAAEIQLQEAQQTLAFHEQELQYKRSLLKQNLQQRRSEIQYIQTELQDDVQGQRELSWEAYRQGEIPYTAYLIALDTELELRLDFLEKLYQYHVLLAEWGYWK